MVSNNPKSILKEPTIDLYEDVISGGKRAEKLFDKLFGVCPQKYDRRPPLKTIHSNLSTKQKHLNSSDFDEQNLTVIDLNDHDFEPKAKTSRTKVKKKNDNRVKFVDNIDQKVNKANKKKNKLSKKETDYPNCTKESLLKAFQNANLPDYEEIARHELIVTKVNGNDVLRADPPTPPLYEILKPFEDLIDWSKVDMKSDVSQTNVPLKQSKQTERKTTSTAGDWETTHETYDQIQDNDNVFDASYASNKKQLTSSLRDEIKNPLTLSSSDVSSDNNINSTVIPKKCGRIRTAGLGDSRIASTPVSRRLNITLRSHNLSPIKSIDSPESNTDTSQLKVCDKLEQTFVAPLPPTNRRSRKASIANKNCRLDVVTPSLSDIEKVTLRTDRAQEVMKSLTDVQNLDNCDEIPAIVEETDNLIAKTSSVRNIVTNKSSSSASSDPLIVSTDVSYSLRSVRNKISNSNRTKEFSSIFAPKIKSTPLVSTKRKSNISKKGDSMQSQFDLFVDESHLDVSMSKLFPSKSYSHVISFPRKTTTCVRVLDSESNRRQTVDNKSIAYKSYRKSFAAIHSFYNKSCHPCRIVVNARTLNKSCHRVASGLQNREDLKQYIDNSLTVVFSASKVVFNDGIEEILTAKQKVLLLCEPNEIIDLKYVFESNILKNCKKIGEGSYGEVYASKDVCGNDIVIKIIPLNMSDNSEEDMFSQILPELVISSAFSCLKSSHNFIHMIKATCARGLFPNKLIDEWDLFAQQKLSENEDPRIYDKNQFYIVLQLANGGTDLETYKFKNAIEAFSLFSQLSLSLAVAESEYKFEHRDMHWGNVLITQTNETLLGYKVKDNEHILHTNGVFASIIDFSLSRMSKDGFIIYDDLGKYKDLFEGEGDYQFDIYRMMKSHNNNDWEKFSPKTNVFWLHYLLDKLLNSKKYSSRSKVHKTALNSLHHLFQNVLKFDSATHFVSSELFKQYLKHLNSRFK